MRTLICNVSQLAVIPPGSVRGRAMGEVSVLEKAAIVIDGEKIAWFGPESGKPSGPFDHAIDAVGGCVTPGLVDCHTHVVFAGDRSAEFVQRAQGATYEAIMRAGGGIRNSMKAVRAANEDELVNQSAARLRRMLACGTTTVEIKSGYGLSADAEIKMLRVIRRLSQMLPMEIVATFLGAHAIPPEFDGRPDEYVAAITDDRLLEQIRGENLAEFADIFCDRGAFSVDQSRRFLTACKAFGLTPRVHAEQLSSSGATRMAVELGASSADHLEYVTDDDITALQRSTTIPVLLPGCTLFLGGPPAPARRMIDAGLPVALATDCNPGSSMIESLGVIMSIATTTLKMTPMEALVACTANAAAAIGRQSRIGAIRVGHAADLLVLDIPRLELWPYRVGVNPVRTVIRRGQIVS